jgi:enamine deaminase RidA (YjgF/YER057c/UK114 family)
MPFIEVRPDEICRPTAPLSVATVTGTPRLLHISGQVSQDQSGATVGIGDVVTQTRQVLQNLTTIVEAEGGSLRDICKLSIFLTSRDHLRAVMDVRRQVLQPPYPATTAVIVAGLANADWLVEIEATAALP